jgi:hypothetical protein
MNDESGSGVERRRWLRSPVRLALAACVGLFACAVLQFHDPVTGFSSLISIGDAVGNNKVAALRQVPHHVYEKSAGYDGAYYVQLAMHPTLDNPELAKSIDNLPYRARRMLFCWAAWLLGLGQPAWIVQAHALLNVLAWFGLAWVITKWFPPTCWDRFYRWFAVMFSHGVCMSVRNSLVDLPSLLLVALALRWIEQGRRGPGGVVLALAGLGKETNVLAGAALAHGAAWRSPRAWLRFAGTVGLIALPLLAWMAYIRWKFGPADDPGMGNFTRPLAGLAEKWGDAIAAVSLAGDTLNWATLAAVFALTVQFLFLLVRWRSADPWWRVGATFALMMIFLSTPVWEGFPGAFTRVLLPMTLAFNVLVPRGRRWLPLLLAGNLSVVAGALEFTPPQEFYRIDGDGAVVAALQIERVDWHAAEYADGKRWRWSAGHSALRIVNRSGGPLAVTLRGEAGAAAEPRELRIEVNGAVAWSRKITVRAVPFEVRVPLPPGEALVRFDSELPPESVGDDARRLAFAISNLEVLVAATPSPP